MRNLRYLLAAATVTAGATSAHAEYYKDLPYGWTVLEGESSCSAITQWDGEGETQLILMKGEADSFSLALSNYNWTSVKGEKYNIRILLDNNSYGGSDSLGFSNSGRMGFVAKLNDAFALDFAKASAMRAFLDDALIDNLSLKGSANAISSLLACYRQLRSRLHDEAAKKAALDYIPRDPFAKLARPPVPRGTESDWAAMATLVDKKSYVGLRGTAKYSAQVDVVGKVTACEISVSSGDAAIDQATCELVLTRGRFDPATDGEGNSVAGHYDGVAKWKM